MITDRTLLFFDPMFGDPEPLDWQVYHLTPLRHFGWLGAQILLAVLTAFDGMKKHPLQQAYDSVAKYLQTLG